jgi:hypothetical protein
MFPDCCLPLAPANGTNITNKKDVPTEDKHLSPGLKKPSLESLDQSALIQFTHDVALRPQVPVIGEKARSSQGDRRISAGPRGTGTLALGPIRS